MRRNFSVREGAAGERLDVSLAKLLGVARAQAQKLIKNGAVQVGAEPQPASYQVESGDKISVDLPEETNAKVEVPDLPVVYEDTDILVVDKPAGLTVHEGSGTKAQPTAADFARTRTSDPDTERPGIVHRLDKDTSGLLIIAKSAESKAYMQRQFREHKVNKTYMLLVVGRVKPAEAIIVLPVGRHPTKGLKQTVAASGRQAVTRYQTVATYPGYTLLDAMPETGRTHQLRVHFSAIGHPVAGDTTYGLPKRALGLTRQFLHAARLSFTAPSGKEIALQSPLPPDLEKALQVLNSKL